MARVDQYYRRRYGGAPDTLIQQEQTIQSIPDNQIEYGDLTPTELRLLGRNLNMKEKFLGQIKEKISHVKSNRDRRADEGREDAASFQLQRLQGLQSQYDTEYSEYQAMRARLAGETYSKAKAAAPKQYNEQRLRERNYDPGGQLADTQIAMKQRRSFVQARELAGRQPGIYRYRSGGAFISSAADGTYRNERGQTVSVRTPVASSVNGGFIYNPVQEPERRFITGIDLSNPQNVAAIRGSAGEFKTVGALFASANQPGVSSSRAPFNPETATFKEAFLRSWASPSDGQEYLLQTRNPIIKRSTGIFRGVRGAGTLIRMGGEKVQSFVNRYPQFRGPIPNDAQDYAIRTFTGLGSYAESQPILFSGEVAASYVTGGASGALYGTIERRLAARSVLSTVLRRGAETTGMTVLGYQLATQSPEQFGSSLPGLAGFGSGFKTGYRSVVPRVEFLGFSDSRGVGAYEVRAGRNSITGGGTSTRIADISVNGRIQSVPVRVDQLLSGRRYNSVRRLRVGGMVDTFSKSSRGYYNVEVLQAGTFSAGGRDYYLSGKSFQGAFNPRGRLFVASSGDSFFASENVPRIRPSNGRSFGRFAILDGRVPTVRGGGVEVRGSERLGYQKTIFGRATSETPFGDLEYFGFGATGRSYTSGGFSSRTIPRGGASSQFLNRAFGFAESTNILPRTRIEPRPYTDSFSETLFPRRFNRVYSGFPTPRSTPVGSSVLRPYPVSPRGVGRTGFAPFTGRLPFLPEATSFGSRSPFLIGRLPRLRNQTPTLTSPRQRPFFSTVPYQPVIPGIRMSTSQISGTDFNFRTSSDFFPSPPNRPPTPPVFIPGFTNSPPITPRRPGFPGVGSFFDGGYGGGGRARRGYRYAPDLYSTLFGIKAKGRKARALQGRTFTGLEIRPLV